MASLMLRSSELMASCVRWIVWRHSVTLFRAARLLSLAVLVSFCIRGSRNRKPKQADSEDPEVGKSFVENENVVKGGDGVIDLIDNVYDDAIKDNSMTDSSIHSSDNSENNTSDSASPSDDDKDRREPQ